MAGLPKVHNPVTLCMKLDLLDMGAEYGITAPELAPFNDRLDALANMPSNEREKAFNDLMQEVKPQFKGQDLQE